MKNINSNNLDPLGRMFEPLCGVGLKKKKCMINYLITNFQEEEEDKAMRCIKVGKTGRTFEKSRSRMYNTHSGPRGWRILGIRESPSEMFERFMHIKYSSLSIPNPNTGRGTEWCLFSQEMVDDFFQETEESLGRWVWENMLEIRWRSRGDSISGKERTAARYLNKIYKTTPPLKTLLTNFIKTGGQKLPSTDEVVAKYLSKMSLADVNPKMTLRQLEIKYESRVLSDEILNNVNKVKYDARNTN